MKWIWPFSWYWRIRELEREMMAVKAAYLELDHKYRAREFVHTAQQACWRWHSRSSLKAHVNSTHQLKVRLST